MKRYPRKKYRRKHGIVSTIIFKTKVAFMRTFVDPTYRMTPMEKKYYYRNKDISEARQHEKEVAQINSHQYIHQDIRENTKSDIRYENMTNCRKGLL